MNSLFEMRSPLYIKYADGETRLVEALFEHPKGVLYFELFWENDPKYSIHIIEGQIKGEGPWKVGDCSFHVLGCNHTHPQLCEMQSYWRQEKMLNPENFRGDELVKIAAEKGVILPENIAVNLDQYEG